MYDRCIKSNSSYCLGLNDTKPTTREWVETWIFQDGNWRWDYYFFLIKYMKKHYFSLFSLIVLMLFSFGIQNSFASSCTKYGSTSYCSDGTSYNQYGNTTYGSDGSSYTKYGNTTYGNDGSSYTKYGNTTYGTGGGNMIESCPSNSTLNSTSGKCECSYGYKASGSSCVYDYSINETPSCPLNSRYDSVSSSCKCNYGYVNSGSNCVYKTNDYSNTNINTNTDLSPNDKKPATVSLDEFSRGKDVKVIDPQKDEPIKMTREEYKAKYGQDLVIEKQNASGKLVDDSSINKNIDTSDVQKQEPQANVKKFVWWNPFTWLNK